MKKSIRGSLYYDVSSDDPGSWEIDYTEFFMLIEDLIEDIGYEIIDSDHTYTYGGEICYYSLDNGVEIDTYPIEVDLLSALADGQIDAAEIPAFVEDYLRMMIDDTVPGRR